MDAALTILAPTHDRPDVLDLVWPSWLKQSGIREIVVVNDGSAKDYTSVFARISEACRSRDVRFVPINNKTRMGAPAAKNLGLKCCTSDEILTTDDDIVLPDDVTSLCRQQRLKVGSNSIIGPRVIYLQDGELEASALHRSNQDTSEYFNRRSLTLVPWACAEDGRSFPFVTAVALWPRSVFARGLRYYEGYGGNGYREETDPQLAAQSEFGCKVYLASNAYCFHLAPAIAYANRSGQRRGGVLWFEYWVARNNFIFLWRHGAFLHLMHGINPYSAWISLLMERLSFRRLVKFFARRTRQ